MKWIYTLGLAALLGILAAWWFRAAEESVPAVSNDIDATRHTAGNAGTMQRNESRQSAARSSGAAAGSDVESNDSRAVSAGKANLPTLGTDRAAQRDTPETIPKKTAITESSQPSEIDKTACQGAARTLDESSSIFDVTPTQAVWYSRSRSAGPHSPPSAFTVLKARLLGPLCSGSSAFNRDYEAQMEFVAIGTDSHVRILLGDHWISDGTVLSQLSEADQAFFANSFIQVRRRIGPGPGKNVLREDFERLLARNPRQLMASP
jgi:hypothetical protein